MCDKTHNKFLVSSMTTKEWVRNYGKDFLLKKTNLLVFGIYDSLGNCIFALIKTLNKNF